MRTEEEAVIAQRMLEKKSVQNRIEAEKYGKIILGKSRVVTIEEVEIGEEKNVAQYLLLRNSEGEESKLFLSQWLEVTIDKQTSLVEGSKKSTKGKTFIIPQPRSTRKVESFLALLDDKPEIEISLGTDGIKLPFKSGLHFADKKSSNETAKEQALRYLAENGKVQTMYKFKVLGDKVLGEE